MLKGLVGYCIAVMSEALCFLNRMAENPAAYFMRSFGNEAVSSLLVVEAILVITAVPAFLVLRVFEIAQYVAAVAYILLILGLLARVLELAKMGIARHLKNVLMLQVVFAGVLIAGFAAYAVYRRWGLAVLIAAIVSIATIVFAIANAVGVGHRVKRV